VTKIVGRITRMWQEGDSRARFEASVADTPDACTALGLIDKRDGREPYVRGVSIRAASLWALGPPADATALSQREHIVDQAATTVHFT
jgi:hypothetical protein